MPLFYENIDELSFNQYNIEEKKSKQYKCFSYISFYEGARIALNMLEKEGYKVSLYVFDVGENDTKKTSEALNYKEMKDMDLIIPLVFKNSFDLISSFAEENKIAVVNPMSPSDEILKNECVFKIQPDDISVAETIMKYVSEKHKDANAVILFEDGQGNNALINWYKENITNYTSSWTIINYKKNSSKLNNYIKPGVNNIVISLVTRKTENDNKLFASNLLKTLSSQKNKKITLFAPYGWLDYNNLDYSLLESLDYHFTLPYLNDYSNPNFVDFVKEYRTHFKTEPDKIYAALGYDITMYFVKALGTKGNNLLNEPNIKDMYKMINRYHFKHKGNYPGWQNERTTVYNIKNYKIKSEWSY